MWPWMQRRYKPYQCKTYTLSAPPYHVAETNPSASCLLIHISVIASTAQSAKLICVRESESQRDPKDVSGGGDVVQGANLPNSLFNLEHIRPECPDPSYQVAPDPPFDHIITDLNGTKRRRSWINQGLEMDLYIIQFLESESKGFLVQNVAFVPWGPFV